MTDRSYLRVTVRKDHADLFAKRVFGAESWDLAILEGLLSNYDLTDEDTPAGFVVGGFSDCNHSDAMLYDRDSACVLGLVFYGYMGACPGAYTPMVFACDGSGEVFAASAEDDFEAPICRVFEDGAPDEMDLQACRDYWGARNRIAGGRHAG